MRAAATAFPPAPMEIEKPRLPYLIDTNLRVIDDA